MRGSFKNHARACKDAGFGESGIRGLKWRIAGEEGKK
jgi:hypothetical protein